MNRSRGFTLTELIITVAIVAIVLAIGIPSFQGMMRNNRVAAHTNEFLSSLNLARSEAIKRGWRVVLCPGNATTGCAGWGGNEWMVFVDADANGNDILDEATDNNGQWDNGEVILRIYQLDDNSTLQNLTFPDPFISFTRDGTTRRINNAPQAGRLFFSLCNTNNQRNEIVINFAGRVRVEQVACP